MLSLTEIFASVGAPLANSRWSWGAQRRADGAVFLRVWQDECKKIEGKRVVCLNAREAFEDKSDNLGYVERNQHVAQVRNGNPCYLIMCHAVDPKASPRTIANFNGREVFVGGELHAFDGDAWIELKARATIGSVRPNKSLERARER